MTRIPTEAEEQTTLMTWAALESKRRPELLMLHHIPNGGSRHPAEAANLKAQGVKPGVPDLCLPVPRGKYHGLYIEMKRKERSKTNDDQLWWLRRLNEEGYFAVVCKGCEVAKHAIMAYLEGRV